MTAGSSDDTWGDSVPASKPSKLLYAWCMMFASSGEAWEWRCFGGVIIRTIRMRARADPSPRVTRDERLAVSRPNHSSHSLKADLEEAIAAMSLVLCCRMKGV